MNTMRVWPVLALLSLPWVAQSSERTRDSLIEHEAALAVQQPGPHEGTGMSTGYPFFEGAEDFRVMFRKRALHPGASIGEHVNDKDEIYYILSGRGELTLNGERSEVTAGDAILTRDGHSHALRQLGDEDLVILVVFPKRPTDP